MQTGSSQSRLWLGPEVAGLEQASGYVLGEVAEPEGDAAQVLEAPHVAGVCDADVTTGSTAVLSSATRPVTIGGHAPSCEATSSPCSSRAYLGLSIGIPDAKRPAPPKRCGSLTCSYTVGMTGFEPATP